MNLRLHQGRSLTDFILCLRITDYPNGIHFGPGSGKRQDVENREAPGNLCFFFQNIPCIPIIESRCADELCAVDDGAAAHRQKHLDAFFLQSSAPALTEETFGFGSMPDNSKSSNPAFFISATTLS